MSEDQRDPNVEVTITFSASTTLDLSVICEEIGINMNEIARLFMKYCNLYFVLVDGREIEYSTTAYEAELDTKYPDHTSTFIDNKCVAVNHEGRGEIEVKAQEPVMYVLMRYYGTSSEWSPVFASHDRYQCEVARDDLHNDVPAPILSIITVPTTFHL